MKSKPQFNTKIDFKYGNLQKNTKKRISFFKMI